MADKDGSAREPKDGKDYEFLPPDFDEDQFIHREMVSFKTTSILFVWGIVAAAVSWGIFAAVGGSRMGWFLGLLVCAGGYVALRPLFKAFKADIKHWARREWIGTAFLFFFTWLGVFIVAVNPPISDYAPPRVDVHVGPPVQQAGGLVTLDLFFEDNDAVASHTFRLSQGGLALADEDDLIDLGRGHYRYAQSLPAGVYDVAAHATDRKGNEDGAEASFAVVETALRVFLPDGNTLDAPTDQVLVQVASDDLPTCKTSKGRITNAPCIRTVHLDHADGSIPMEYSTADSGWKATSNFAGWTLGENVVTVSADVVGSWVGSVFVEGGRLTSGPYTLNVSVEPGTYVPKVLAQPQQTQRNVPGLELPAVGIGLLAVAMALRSRKR